MGGGKSQVVIKGIF